MRQSFEERRGKVMPVLSNRRISYFGRLILEDPRTSKPTDVHSRICRNHERVDGARAKLYSVRSARNYEAHKPCPAPYETLSPLGEGASSVVLSRPSRYLSELRRILTVVRTSGNFDAGSG